MRRLLLSIVVPLAACAAPDPLRPPGARASQGALQLIDWRATNSVGTAGATLFGTAVSSTPDTLLAITADLAERTTLHVTSSAGTMQDVGFLPLAAGEPLVLRDRSTHAMMESLSATLVPGDSLTIQLRFAAAGTVELRVPVFRLTEASAELP